eukprot:358543-Chlamydomonas_euryale.AAC.5
MDGQNVWRMNAACGQNQNVWPESESELLCMLCMQRVARIRTSVCVSVCVRAWVVVGVAFKRSFRRHSWRVHAEEGKPEAKLKLRPHLR